MNEPRIKRWHEIACRAAREINPENPEAAAETMPEIFRLLEAVVIDSCKVSHGKLNLDEWLSRAHSAILKATAKE